MGGAWHHAKPSYSTKQWPTHSLVARHGHGPQPASHPPPPRVIAAPPCRVFSRCWLCETDSLFIPRKGVSFVIAEAANAGTEGHLPLAADVGPRQEDSVGPTRAMSSFAPPSSLYQQHLVPTMGREVHGDQGGHHGSPIAQPVEHQQLPASSTPREQPGTTTLHTLVAACVYQPLRPVRPLRCGLTCGPDARRRCAGEMTEMRTAPPSTPADFVFGCAPPFAAIVPSMDSLIAVCACAQRQLPRPAAPQRLRRQG